MDIQITENPDWVKELIEEITLFEMSTINNPPFNQAFMGDLHLDQLRQIMIDLYPLVESFPRYLELILAKIPMEDSYRCQMTRSSLIRNILHKQQQVKQYRDWMRGFHVDRNKAGDPHFPCPEVDAVNNFLWRVCTYGSLTEAVTSLNFTTERLMRIWSIRVLDHLEWFRGSAGVDLNQKSLAWLNGNADCHDHYPEEALEIIKAFSTPSEARSRLVKVAQHATVYFIMATNTGGPLSPYVPSPMTKEEFTRASPPAGLPS